MIPAEAVEAAAKAAWEKSNSDPWISGDADDLRWADRRAYLDDAKVMLEAAAPHMLATVSTAAELDALPRFTVIRSDEGAVFERQTMWHEAGSRDLMCSPDITLPVTVLQLGWGEE